VTLDLETAGTATRFLTAAAMLAASGSGPITIDGNARMRERPIAELGDLLRRLGVTVQYAEREGFPPVRVYGTRAAPVTELEVGVTASSQFVSGLLMAAPFLPEGLTLRFTSAPTSRSYIDMTTRLMTQLGLRVESSGSEGSTIRVRASRLFRFDYDVEPDASGATYFWAAAALHPGAACVVPGLDEHSLQGDAKFTGVLENMGARVSQTPEGMRVVGGDHLDGLVEDLSMMPDAAMTLAAVCCFTPPGSRSLIGGLRTLRVKETDRLAALETELRKVGMHASTRRWTAQGASGDAADEALCLVVPDGGIDRSPTAPRVEFDTYNDHRMAMALALIGLRRPNVFIRNPACVAKTYPTFWRDFATLYSSGG
jgi:3-phosphoshikimate 1-carboxyvinyltransferase